MSAGTRVRATFWGEDGRTLYTHMNDEEAVEWRSSCGLPASSAQPVAVLQLPRAAAPPVDATAALLSDVVTMLVLLHRLVDEVLLAWGADHFRDCSPSVGGHRQPPHPPGAPCERPPPAALSEARELLAHRRPAIE